MSGSEESSIKQIFPCAAAKPDAGTAHMRIFFFVYLWGYLPSEGGAICANDRLQRYDPFRKRSAPRYGAL